ncbi:unnamed protein product [Brassicogethes aeneus]|uniref:Luciferin 4-monooxygenase n=1 Tax=Brassicogethes aeneus TaxID=1431903 RepID=A0A9P0AW85_BRAAE|nr:unnamed protein product [Brassicogethes aeneus]
MKSGDPNKVVLIDHTSNEVIPNKILLEWSISLAKYLKSQGYTQKEDVIAIVSPNTWKYYVVLNAGLFLGIPMNALNPIYNKEEFKHCFSITKPTIIFASVVCLKTLENYRRHTDNSIKEIILLEDVIDDNFKNICYISQQNSIYDDYILEKVDPKKQTALILLSSGTSGLPKAVALTHYNIRHSMEYLMHPDFVGLDEKSVSLVVLPMFHIFGLLISFTCMTTQSKSIFLTQFKPDIYLKAIEEHKVTNLFLVPSLLLFLAKTPLLQNYNMDSVTNIFCGAAPAGKELELCVKKRFRNAEIKQIYGVTELAGAVTMTTKTTTSKHGSVGVPVPGTIIKIIDLDTKKVLPLGKKGEVCIKSPGCMKGYVANDLETRNSFDDDEFLKTGDLGYFDEDGVLFIVDRLKEVIKYKGFQVSPAELEDLLKKLDGVMDVGVVGKPDERSGELPVAFVVKAPECDITEETLINYVADNLSAYKGLHGGVIFVDKLPKNSTGKLLRRELIDQLKI